MPEARRLPVVLALLVLLASAADGAGLSDSERKLVEVIDSRQSGAMTLLQQAVDINSGTMNFPGVKQVGELFGDAFEALGLQVSWVDGREFGRAGHLVARHRGNGPHLLLIGHLDTVFEPGDPFQAFERDGDRAHGPGALDMKGGDVAILLALEGLAAADALDALTLTVYLTGDEEEPGRPLAATRGGLVEAAKAADVALGFEEGCCLDGDGRGTDLAVVARRSSIPWRLEVEGVHSHSSVIFSEDVGAGAVFEAARILHGFYDELAAEEALTFNVGTLLAGSEIDYDPESDRGTVSGKRNIVPARAVAYGGLRALTPEQLEGAQARMREIAAANLPRTSAALTFEEGYPPMPPTEGNRRLLALYDRVSRDLGLGPVEAFPPAERGAADVSFAAPHADALGGLGPVGEGSHTPREWVSLPTIIQSAQRAALLLHRLGRDGKGP